MFVFLHGFTLQHISIFQLHIVQVLLCVRQIVQKVISLRLKLVDMLRYQVKLFWYLLQII